jgi:hypothetical protein
MGARYCALASDSLAVRALLVLALVAYFRGEAQLKRPPLGLDTYLPIPAGNPLTRENTAGDESCFSTSAFRMMERFPAGAAKIRRFLSLHSKPERTVRLLAKNGSSRMMLASDLFRRPG